MKNLFCILLLAVMFFAQCSYAAGEQAAETETPIHGANDKTIWVEEFNDE